MRNRQPPALPSSPQTIERFPHTDEAAYWQATTLDASPDAIIGTTPDGIIRLWNRGAEQLFGYTSDEAVGHHIRLIVPRHLVPQRSQLGKTLDGAAIVAAETTRRSKSGCDVRVVVRQAVVRGAAGTAIGVLEIAREIGQGQPAVATPRAELLTRLFFAQDDERRRIARDLHDQLGQQLTALRLTLAMLKEQIDGQTAVRDQVDALIEMARQLDDEVSFRVGELRLFLDDHRSLEEALRQYLPRWSRQFGVGVDLQTPHTEGPSLPPAAAAMIYRIVQESLNNVAKHARARHVEVALARTAGHLMVIIEDDGIGLTTPLGAHDPDKLGLIGMRERAGLLGARIEIESTGRGTAVILRYPLPAAAARVVDP